MTSEERSMLRRCEMALRDVCRQWFKQRNQELGGSACPACDGDAVLAEHTNGCAYWGAVKMIMVVRAALKPEECPGPDPDVWEEATPWDEEPDPRLDTSARLRAKHGAKPSLDPDYMAEKVEAARQRIPGDSPEEAEARRRWDAGERPPAEYQMMKYGASHAPVHSLYGIGHESRQLPKRMDEG